MKALKELLKYKQSIIDDARNNGHFPWLQDVDEAISEYEALQQHIKDLESQLSSNTLQLTCDDRCVYWMLGGGCSGNFLVKCNRSNALSDKFKLRYNK